MNVPDDLIHSFLTSPITPPSSHVVIHGYLEKKKDYSREWKQRYCILYSNGWFYGFKNDPRPDTQPNTNASYELSRPWIEPNVHNRYTIDQSTSLQFLSDEFGSVSFWVGLINEKPLYKDGSERNRKSCIRMYKVCNQEHRDKWVKAFRNFSLHARGMEITDITQSYRRSKKPQPVIMDTPDSKSSMRLIKPLSDGIFGNCFLAEKVCKKTKSKSLIVIRELSKQKVLDDGYIKYAMVNDQGFEELTRMSHKFFVRNIPPCFEDDLHLFYCEEFVNGGTLFHHLDQRETAFRESTVKFYLVQIILAFNWLHERGIIYDNLRLRSVCRLVYKRFSVKYLSLSVSRNIYESI